MNNRDNIRFHISDTFELLSRSTANHISSLLNPLKEQYAVSFTGGSSPRLFLNHLADSVDNWYLAQVMLTDERLVEFENQMSNTGFIYSELLDRIDENRSEFLNFYYQDRDETGMLETVNQRLSEIINSIGLHLVCLGFGADGHTASIFPQKRPFYKELEYCGLTKRENENYMRISLNYNAILSAKNLMIFFRGADRADAFEAALFDTETNETLPVRYILENYNGYIHIFCDTAAAARIRI